MAVLWGLVVGSVDVCNEHTSPVLFSQLQGESKRVSTLVITKALGNGVNHFAREVGSESTKSHPSRASNMVRQSIHAAGSSCWKYSSVAS